jgi:hypothetical protein
MNIPTLAENAAAATDALAREIPTIFVDRADDAHNIADARRRIRLARRPEARMAG